MPSSSVDMYIDEAGTEIKPAKVYTPAVMWRRRYKDRLYPAGINDYVAGDDGILKDKSGIAQCCHSHLSKKSKALAPENACGPGWMSYSSL